MGLFSKIKNVLFEEEEIEIPVFTKEKETTTPVKRTEKRVEKSVVKEDKPIVKKETIKATTIKEKKEEFVEDSERETFKTEPTFQFPVFDEKEYSEPQFTRASKDQNNTKSDKIRNNIKKNAPKKIDFGRFDEKPKKEEEPKRFVPSPVISPVYGILDKNYSKVDIKPKNSKTEKVVDVDSIRKKAYGTLEEEIQKTMEQPVNDFYEEKPTKSINELLNDVIDEEIPLDETIDIEKKDSNIEEVEDTKSSLDLLDDIEKEVKRESNLEDTLESDLFNLIDSMYADREEEKE